MRAPALARWEVLSQWKELSITGGSGTQPINSRDLQGCARGLGRARATHTSVPEHSPGRGEPQGGVFTALSYAQRSLPVQQGWCGGVGPLWRSGAWGPFTIGAVCPD